MNPIRTRNQRILAICTGVVFLMVGMSFAAVPLYDIFCRVTGYAGTTQTATAESTVVTDRVMKIRFDAMVNGIDWAFQPAQREIEVRVGQNILAFYNATNRSSRPVTGTAVFNVTPLKAGLYFSKVQCFCFTEQRLAAGESVEMPVSFYVDPAIEKDPNLNDVKTITLSYTFYPAAQGESGKPEARQNVSAVDRRAPAAVN